MKITKTTINMAAKRNIAIVVNEDDRNLDGLYRRREGEVVTTVELSAIGEDGEAADEYAALYRLTGKGMFFIDSLTGDRAEWPHWIEDESTMRGLLDAMAAEVAA
jgi:hypothetical protein